MRRLSLAAAAAAVWLLAAAGSPDAQQQEQGAGADTTAYRVSIGGSVKSTIEDGERVIFLENGVRIDHQTTTITSLRGRHYPARHYTVLTDSVRVVDGTAVMTSDVGEYRGETNIVTLEGKVRIVDRGWWARCDRAEYDRARRIAFLTGSVKLADSTRTLYADTIVYDRDREIADATGSVVLIDDVEDYSIAGRHARYDRLRKYAVVDVKPILTFDLASPEKGTVASRIMRFDIERNIGVAEGDVQMVKGETRASCDSATIFDEEGKAHLSGNPRATNGSSSMSGDLMELRYNENEVERIVLPEKGRLTQAPAAGSPWKEDSWIEGDSIAIFLSDEKVDSVAIVSNAKAMYYPVEGDANKVSNNFSTGDNMFFMFKNEELAYIRMSGASTGLYRYVNLAPRETTDSLASTIDSTLVFKSFARRNERVQYSADRIEYFADTENVLLRGNAVLKYQNSSLEASRIDFNSDLNLLEATGDPVLEEDGQRVYGLDMGYDMDNAGGVVVDGSTQYGEGYYQGDDLFKVGSDVLKVYNSTYTTCDYEDSHYSFRADRMKVYVNDKIVTGPIFLYVGRMPVFYLPFMVNSLHRDRSSGFLKPNFDVGMGSREGRFVRGLGYYWATNDYTDFELVTNFNERRNFRFQLINNYKLRYVLEGDVSFDFVRSFPEGEPKTNEWQIEADHSQTFSPSASFTSSLRFVSSDGAQSAIDASEDLQRYVNRKIYSSASFRKSWGGTSLSLSANRNQRLNLTDPTEPRVTTTMPSFSLNFPQRSLWFGEKHAAGSRSVWERALRGVTFRPQVTATRQTEESEVKKYATLSSSYGTSFGQQLSLGFLGLSPSVGFNWNYFRVLRYSVVDSLKNRAGYIRPADRNDYTMSLGSGLSTKFYGTFYPRIGALAGIRHTIEPSVSYSFRPKLKSNQTESQGLSWSLRNSIDLKMKRGAEEIRRNGVLSWDLDGSYDVRKPLEEAFSNISSRMRLSLGSFISFNLNNTYDPRAGEIVSTNFSTGFDLRGALVYPATWTVPERKRIMAARGAGKAAPAAPGAMPAQEAAGEPGAWSFHLGYNLTQSRGRSADSNVDFSGSVRLSRGWNVSLGGYYDIAQQVFTQRWYSIDRDLHCWRASFKHRQFGDDWSYYFEIAIKAHPDIKYQRGTEALGIGSAFPSGGY